MDSLGERMKRYELVPKNFLVRRMPAVIRIDGKAFHTFTKGCEKPFDIRLAAAMWQTAQALCANIQGAKKAYVQSDEISVLLTDYETITTDAWFDYNVQKVVSISASIATAVFNTNFVSVHSALFDSRVFNLPKEDVCNYFIWRQQDATRNSIQGVGQANFSHEQLQEKSCDDIQEMLFQDKGINWNDLPTWQKRGVCAVKETFFMNTMVGHPGVQRSRWVIDKEVPIFSQDRMYIDRCVYTEVE